MNMFNLFKKKKEKEKFVGLYDIIYRLKSGRAFVFHGKFVIEEDKDITNKLKEAENLYRRDTSNLLCVLSNDKNEITLIERTAIETITFKFMKKMSAKEYFKEKK